MEKMDELRSRRRRWMEWRMRRRGRSDDAIAEQEEKAWADDAIAEDQAAIQARAS